MMKTKTLILALMALVVVACSKNVILPEEIPDSTIDFSWYANRSGQGLTKANPAYFVGGTDDVRKDRNLNDGTSMGVFGYFHAQDNGVAGGWKHGAGVYNAPNLFYNEQVAISESSGTYSYNYTNSRYWPKNALDRISFIAYYPWNALNTSGSASENTIVEPFLDTQSKREGMVGFYYVVPESSEDQVDFMVSDLCLDQSKQLWTNTSHAQGLTGAASGKVKFFFHHALSQVRVKSVTFDTGGNDNVDLTVNYIIFKDVAVFGQCIPVPDEDYYGDGGSSHYDADIAATGRVHVDPTWPVGSLVAKRPNLTSGVSADVCYNSQTDQWNTGKILMMIPHEFFPEATIEVNFDVTRWKDHNNKVYLEDGKTPDPDYYWYRYSGNTLSAPLTTYEVTGWEPGKIYTYNVSLNLKQIKVKAEVVNWLDAGDDVIMEE